VHNFDDATNSFRMLGVPYLDFLNALHTHLTPRTYLDVGTETGSSLALVGCDAIAVDPQFQLHITATGNRRRTFFFQMPSDTFFATENVRELPGRPVDMAFLDGMHRFEFLLRDLIGTEAACHPRSLILLHDCVPLNPRMALRQWLPGDPAETWTQNRSSASDPGCGHGDGSTEAINGRLKGLRRNALGFRNLTQYR